MRLAALPVSLLQTRPFWILRPPTDPPPLPVLGSEAPDGVRIQGDPMGDSAKERRDARPMSDPDPGAREMVDLGWVKEDVSGKVDAYVDHSFLQKATGLSPAELSRW